MISDKDFDLGPIEPDEIVEARERLLVDYWPHPLTADGRTTIVAEPGQTLANVLQQHHLPPTMDAVAVVNGALIAREAFGSVTLREQDVVQVRVRVHGDNPLGTLLSIAVLVLAPVAAPFVAGALGVTSAIGVAAIGAGLSIGGMLVTNALFPPRLPEIGGSATAVGQPTPQYSLSGGSNRSRRHEPLRMLLGTHRMFPDIAASEYLEYDDEGDQYLNQIFDFGIGDLEIGDIRIGDTLLSSFDEVETQQQVDNITLVAGNVDSISGGEFEAAYPNGRTVGSPWITRRTAADTTRVGFDLVSMHFSQEDDGGLEGRDAHFRVEWKLSTSGSWSGQNVTLESPDGADARTPVRRTARSGRLAAGIYDVRVKIRASYDDDDDLTRITWRVAAPSMKAYQDETANFKGRNALAVRIKATAQLYGRLDRINADCSAKVPDLSGSTWGPTTSITANPAAILLWWFRGYRVDGTLRAGYGMADDNIDFDSLAGWHAFCVDQELTCNIDLHDTRSEDEIAILIAQCGWARVDTSTGKYGVTWENADQPVTAVVNPANIVSDSVTVSYDNENLADEMIGTYIDADSDWQENTLRRPVPQFTITGEFPVNIRLEGVTNGEQAAKEINRAAAAQFYHQRIINWEMDDEGRTIGVGDVVGMANGLLGAGQGGRLLTIGADRRTVGTAFDVDAANGQAWVWLLNDSVLSTTYTRTATQEVRLATALAAAPGGVDEHPTAYRIMLFASNDPYTKVRVTEVAPAGPHSYRFKARDDLAAYYAFRHSDLTAPLIGVGAVKRPCATGFTVTETDLGERVFAWSEPDQEHTGFQIRYGPAGTDFNAMRDMHEGLLPGSPWTSLNRPDGGTWRFGLATVYPDGRRCAVVYVNATVGDVIRGLDGTDGNGIEDIFAATETLTLTAAQRPDNDWGFDEPDAAGGLQWYDGLAGTGFGVSKPYLWRASRRVPGTPAVGADIDEAWADTYRRAGRSGEDPPSGDWEQPVIVGRWAVDGEQGPQGIDGADGADGQQGATGADGAEGQGVEYIFATTAKGVTAIPNNQLPANTWAYDRPAARNGLQWTDGASGLTDAKPKLWRSERAVPGAPSAGDAKGTDWGDWSIPVVVGEFGRGVEYVFARTASATLPEALRPLNAWGFDVGGSRTTGTGDSAVTVAWTDAAPNITEDFQYLWRSEREIVGLPAVGGAVTAQWKAPVIVGRWAVDGEAAAPSIEWIFARTADSVTSIPAGQLPDNAWTFDNPGTRGGLRWHDGAPGLTAALPILWQSQRKVPGGTTAGDTVSDDWTAPVVVGRRGESGVAGSDGTDGRGIEFIFAATSSTTSPASPSNTWGFDTPGSAAGAATRTPSTVWFDAAPNLNATSAYLWMAQRRIPGDPAIGTKPTGTGNWTTPRIVARFGPQGQRGQQGLQGQRGQDGRDGRDGRDGSDATIPRGIYDQLSINPTVTYESGAAAATYNRERFRLTDIRDGPQSSDGTRIAYFDVAYYRYIFSTDTDGPEAWR